MLLEVSSLRAFAGQVYHSALSHSDTKIDKNDQTSFAPF